jgi:hypothetical protein
LKHFIFIVAALLVASCDHKTTNKSDSSLLDEPKTGSLSVDSILTFSFVTNFQNQNISNKSDRQVDLLFNGVNNYFGGHLHSEVDFRTECLPCAPVQEYLGGILFAKRLFITTDRIKYYKNDFGIPDSVKRIKLKTNNRERISSMFQFSDGKATIQYIGISCNDADFRSVLLSYPTGQIKIDSMINASFFEYDLNFDGQMEQFILGARSCSREFVLLRISKS